GGQEFGLRSGTLNVPYIVGLAKAVELVLKNQEKYSKSVLDLRNQLLNFIIKYNSDAKLNGDFLNRLPNNLNIRFPGVNNETMLVALDIAGFAVSAGSACSSRSSQVSHVLNAIGLNDVQARESIRITLGKYNSKKEIKKLAETISVLSKKFKL
ncbi:MAG: aminotransferase class V-fold PLP-dependent enzyme, partial [Patescibacteria group bacterium]